MRPVWGEKSQLECVIYALIPGVLRKKGSFSHFFLGPEKPGNPATRKWSVRKDEGFYRFHFQNVPPSTSISRVFFGRFFTFRTSESAFPRTPRKRPLSAVFRRFSTFPAVSRIRARLSDIAPRPGLGPPSGSEGVPAASQQLTSSGSAPGSKPRQGVKARGRGRLGDRCRMGRPNYFWSCCKFFLAARASSSSRQKLFTATRGELMKKKTRQGKRVAGYFFFLVPTCS